jgi:hypothetical protein
MSRSRSRSAPSARLDAVLFLKVDLRSSREDVQDGGSKLFDQVRQVAPEMPQGEIETPL